jgi:hypothetical protein
MDARERMHTQIRWMQDVLVTAVAEVPHVAD